jgi:cobyrinic acid a,c-diamide synthase
LLYLSDDLHVDDRRFAMAGLFPLSIKMTGGLVQFGYVTVAFTENCLLGPKGTIVRGHSFHYSEIESRSQVETCYHAEYSLSGKDELEGFRRGNVLASYIHLHFRANPVIAESFVATIRRVRSLQAVTA